MSERSDYKNTTESSIQGTTPVTQETIGKLCRLFHDLPETAVHYCDVVTAEGDRRRIKHHPTDKRLLIVEGPQSTREIDPSNPNTYRGLFIHAGTLAAITRDSTDSGFVRIREQVRENEEILRLFLSCGRI